MIKKLSTVALAGALSFGVVSPAFAHDVVSGDTMYKISQEHNLSLSELAKLNPQVTNLDLIFIGDTIKTNSNNVQTSQPKTSPVAYKEVVTASNTEQDLLARLVRAEAESEPYAGKVAVAQVVLNRVDSSQFPNTIEGVIYQSRQFSPVSNGSINRSADSDSIRAVQEAMSNRNTLEGSLFFYNPKTATSRWLDNKPTKVVIGSHVFK